MVTRILQYMIFLVSLSTCLSVSASVTITGSRIIYPSDAKSIDVQLKNNDNIPYVIQTWFDNGDVNSKPDQISEAPFVVTPPVFRIQPEAGQIIRVIYNSKKVYPKDRESVFWFNVLEIPPSNLGGQAHKNTMMVMLRNRMKIFYRPESIGKPGDVLKGLKVYLDTSSSKVDCLVIDNQQPWYISLVNVEIIYGERKYRVTPEMIPPYTAKKYQVCSLTNKNRKQGAVTLSAINDQGARISETYKIDAKEH